MIYQPSFTIGMRELVNFVLQYMYAASFCFLKYAFPFNLRVKKTRQRPCAKVYPWRVALFYVHSLFDGYLIGPSRKRFNGQESSFTAISCVFDVYLIEVCW